MLFSATTLLRRLKFGHLEPVKLPNRIPFVPTFVGKMYRFLGRERPLAFVTAVSAFSAVWSKKHAVVDQLDRASDSLINGRYAELDHRRFLDIAEGSAVKVQAYLDLAVQKLTLGRKECGPGKTLLERIVAMLSRL